MTQINWSCLPVKCCHTSHFIMALKRNPLPAECKCAAAIRTEMRKQADAEQGSLGTGLNPWCCMSIQGDTPLECQLFFLHILDVSNSQYCISKTARFHIPEDDRRMFGNSSHQNENSVIYSPSSCSDPLWISYFCWTQKKIFWRILTKPLPVAIDFHSMENKTKKYYGSQWLLATVSFWGELSL